MPHYRKTGKWPRKTPKENQGKFTQKKEEKVQMPRVCFNLVTAYAAGGSPAGLLIKKERVGEADRGDSGKYSNWKLYQGIGKIIENLHAV